MKHRIIAQEVVVYVPWDPEKLERLRNMMFPHNCSSIRITRRKENPEVEVRFVYSAAIGAGPDLKSLETWLTSI